MKREALRQGSCSGCLCDDPARLNVGRSGGQSFFCEAIPPPSKTRASGSPWLCCFHDPTFSYRQHDPIGRWRLRDATALPLVRDGRATRHDETHSTNTAGNTGTAPRHASAPLTHHECGNP